MYEAGLRFWVERRAGVSRQAITHGIHLGFSEIGDSPRRSPGGDQVGATTKLSCGALANTILNGWRQECDRLRDETRIGCGDIEGTVAACRAAGSTRYHDGQGGPDSGVKPAIEALEE